jgi:pimeloyl-ACP methyl ester carboxylesterase
MARIEVKGSQVNVIEMNAGGGDPVVMIHGLYTNLSVYYFSIAPIIAHEHHVVLYDLRSHGLSDKRDEGYTLEIFSNDLLDLMEILGIPQAHLVGYSYGGAIALYTALTYPDRVRRLALIEAPSLKEEMVHEFIHHFTDRIEDYTRSTGIEVTQSRADKFEEQHRLLVSDGLLSAAVQEDRLFTDTKPLEGLRAPALLLYGMRSELLETSHLFASRIPHATLHFAEGDHNLPVQQRDFITRELENFFKAEDGIASEGGDL